MADGDQLPLEPTPEMIAAGADTLEHINDIGRWLAESLAATVLERAAQVCRSECDRTGLSRGAEGLMTDETRQHGATNADLMMAMVSGLPSTFLEEAARRARQRERREERLRVLQARVLQEAEARLDEAEARAAVCPQAA